MKRVFKIIRRVTLGLVLSFAAFVGGDFGIRTAMQEKQPLTPEQVEKAQAVFGNTIDYSKVRVAFGRVSCFQPEGTTVVIGNTIYFPPPVPIHVPEVTPEKAPTIAFGYTPKISAASDLFIHEMTHIWQNQNNIKGTGVSGAVTLWAKNLFSSEEENVYAYTLDSTKALTDYNLEQQAEIVAVYSTMKRSIAAHPELPAPKEWPLLKKTVEQYIPPAKPAKKSGLKPGV